MLPILASLQRMSKAQRHFLTKKWYISSGKLGTGSQFTRNGSTKMANNEPEGPMVEYQNSLPRLPVPPLKETLDKYLRSLEPILTSEELLNSQKVVERFAGPQGMGQKLHSLLEQRAREKDNWLSDWWLQYAYLEFRSPVVVFSSPGLILPQQDFPQQKDQLEYASKMVVATLDFKHKIDTCQLVPEKAGNNYMDMSQYQKIFSTCRIPGSPRDSLEYQATSSTNRYIIVVNNNHYFKVDVVGQDGKPLPWHQIASQLSKVVQESTENTIPVGILTTQHRQSWSDSYHRLLNENPESVAIIQNSMFLLCLDKPAPLTKGSNYWTHAGHQTLHGDRLNSGNRWYDQTIQFVVSRDGVIGLTYEHSPAEGPPIANLMDYIINYIDQTKSTVEFPTLKTIDNEVPLIRRLPFNLSAESLLDIEEAKKQLDGVINDLDLNCFVFKAFGSDFIKKHRQSPDSFIQIALQLAFYRMHHQTAPTYESASLRKFLRGRTETIRSASRESLAFCRSLVQNEKSANSTLPDQMEALREAISGHKNYVTDAVNGVGVDRLLFGLKLMAAQQGLPTPEIFNDPGFAKSTHFRLSTSQVPVRADALMCYGPAVTDGYGCCYNPHKDVIFFAVSASNSYNETCAIKFGAAVKNSLTQMHDLLIRAQTAKL